MASSISKPAQKPDRTSGQVSESRESKIANFDKLINKHFPDLQSQWDDVDIAEEEEPRGSPKQNMTPNVRILLTERGIEYLIHGRVRFRKRHLAVGGTMVGIVIASYHFIYPYAEAIVGVLSR